ncbi:hypothetical protein [Antribacter gilvus]|uniref:hypothetical protein n=1 Tax=Antribacter gilvus TaxID=2304675 RepID=UPI000F770501|nr:hypothetical protein [Antribacter gilvus]
MTQLRWVNWIRRVVVIVGLVAAVGGVGFAINGATLPPVAPVQVPVTLDSAGYRYLDIEVTGAEPADEVWFAPARASSFTLAATGATRSEHFLARAEPAVYGLGCLVGAIALAPVLASIARREPFAHGNVTRLVVVAVTIAVCGITAPLLPQIQGIRALERTGLADLAETAGPYFVLEPSVSYAPLLVAAVVLAVAAAFHAGERMAADVDGLV